MFKKGCKGCAISQGREKPRFGDTFIELDGGWILNQYGGNEAFLGWLALQPKKHFMEFSELTEEELQTLGPNIKQVDKALDNYWKEKFPHDPIERVYIVYFFESAFGKQPEEWHLHIHLIPRTKKLGRNNPADVAAWKMGKLTNERWFPNEYRLFARYGYRGHPEKARDLIDHLKKYMFGKRR